jgi:citronellol/citronellal dehydrogenase
MNSNPIDICDHVYFITGASRGIGRSIALYLAQKGAKVVIAAKTVEETGARLPGTIHSVVQEIEEAGGQALAVQLDVRNEQQIKDAIAKTIKVFGRLDGVINNAGALYMTELESTRMKDFDLMHALNTRAIDLIIQEALPWLKLSKVARILNISPPIVLDPGWFVFAYTRSKYAMSMATIGYAKQLKQYGIAVNSLWPETVIDTSAVRNKLGGDETVAMSRTPEFVAKAAYIVLTRQSDVTGQFFIDGLVIKASGQKDLSAYRVDPTKPLLLDFFIGEPPKNEEEALKRVVWPDANGELLTHVWLQPSEHVGCRQRV